MTVITRKKPASREIERKLLINALKHSATWNFASAGISISTAYNHDHQQQQQPPPPSSVAAVNYDAIASH